MLYTVQVDAQGALLRMRPLEPDLPSAVEARVEALVRAYLWPLGTREPWSMRVRVHLGPAPRVQLGRSEICPAARSPKGGGVTQVSEMVTSQELSDLQRAGPFRGGVRVGTTGQVLEVRMLQSSGSRMQDELARRAAHQGSYLPELIDGIPVEGWFEIRSRNGR